MAESVERVRPVWAQLSEGDQGIDKDCLALCEAMNQFEGIATIESCCGHGEHPFRIFFEASDMVGLGAVVYFFDRCHCGFPHWQVIARTDCGMRPAYFMVQGPTGEEAYEEAEAIAELMNKYTQQEAIKGQTK